ncbi:MAG TPA: immunoglobulin-like domain-containing protein [Pedobacter sp.]|uniref:immunoglobulin-like domain-containing protein n=1 Tax=Pedobacter sp. TaxID=1411316 RepID=UPI002C9C9278|nr:immunoglobulin-like domain-containing protein [Pedobacter sp.]HMI02519.1 immunoglobulin-like domain-containing protein [Pedobacter sp.]
MKKYINYIGLAFVALVLFSCGKETFSYPEGQVGISKITNYPEVETKGDHLTLVNQGSVYTDAGATSTAGGKDIEYKTEGTVNTAVPGVYKISYTAFNADGFSAGDFRTVVVIGNNVAANDFSGNYARNTNASVAKWTKVSNGVYSVFNPGGAPGTNLTVKIINYEGNKIVIPEQISSDGSITSSDQESTTPAAGGKLSQYKMIIVNGGYGAALRIFDKI